jgi:hypothetical protein
MLVVQMLVVQMLVVQMLVVQGKAPTYLNLKQVESQHATKYSAGITLACWQ